MERERFNLVKEANDYVRQVESSWMREKWDAHSSFTNIPDELLGREDREERDRIFEDIEREEERLYFHDTEDDG